MLRKTGESEGGAAYSVVVSADDEPERWLEERQKLLTATDMPSILGVPGARSALETWYQKKDALMARSESEAIREAKAAGHEFEDFNALMFSKAAGRYVERSQQLIRCTRHPWLGCTLDYTQQWSTTTGSNFAKDGHFGPLELKNAGSHAASDMWPVGGEPHLTWQVQLMVQLIVMSARIGSLSAWLGAPYVHHRWLDLEYDKELRAIILEEGLRFWKSLRRKTPPKDEPSAARFEVLRRLDPKRLTGKVISLPKQAQGVHSRIMELEAQVAERRAAHEAAKGALELERAKMAELIGENAGGKLEFGTVWLFKHVQVPAHTVGAYSYRTLTRASAHQLKPKRTTWKTSR